MRIDARQHHPRVELVAIRRGRRRWPGRSCTRMRATGASVRISAPASRAAAAIAFEIAPVPPRAKPQERNAPSISPM